MSEIKEVAAPNITLDVVKADFKLELAKKGFEDLQKQALNFVVTEENLEQVKEIFKKVRAFKTIVEDKHTEKKKPHLEAGRVVDKAKTDTMALIDTTFAAMLKSYTKVSQDVMVREAASKREEQRIASIKDSMDKSILDYSSQIAQADTIDKLIKVGQQINLRKGAPQLKNLYQEFLPTYKDRLEDLSKAVEEQKVAVKAKIALEKKSEEAELAGDEESILDIQEQLSEVDNKIAETKITVQEKVIDHVTNSRDVVYARPILPTVSARRTNWKYEVVDLKLLQKKMPHLVKLVADEEAIDALLKSKKTDGSLKDKDEEMYFGIRFFAEKLF